MLRSWRASAKSSSSRWRAATVTISNPGKVYFPEAGISKLDVVRYYLAVAEGALRGAGGRPNVLVRYADGIHGEFFYQKRAPAARPDWIEVVALRFPSGRAAEEVVPRDAAALAWMANLGCLELHPHPVRAEDLEHPDELRVDLDPMPGVEWSQLQHGGARRAARCWPTSASSAGRRPRARAASTSTCASSARWSFTEVRRAALALAREVERRAPDLATSKWWKEERHGVFLDYNQNAKDRTVAGAYSVRPKPDARVSAPVTWDELFACAPEDVHACARCRRASPRSAIATPASTRSPGSLEALLELSARQEAEGLGDAPWPPHYAKQAGEPPRVQPSKRTGAATTTTGRRVSSKPLIEIARAAKKDDALAGLERWKARHPRRRRAPRARRRPGRLRCAAGRRPGRACASISSTCRRRCGRARKPSIRTTIRGPALTPGRRKISASSAGGVTSSWS